MIVLVDERMDERRAAALMGRGFEVIRLKACETLQKPVSSHPDMLLFVGKGKLFCHETYYKSAKAIVDYIVEKKSLELLLSDEEWGETYPSDVLFNAVPMGERLICNKKGVSALLLEAYGEENIINVNQGYARCSTCTVGDRALITADRSIAKAAQGVGIDVLLLCGSHTKLNGYNEGFIGGASGDDGEHIFFCGNVDLHPEADRIKTFCNEHGREAVSLSDDPLYDYGSLMFI